MFGFGHWNTVRDTGIHRYQVHSRTGKRRIIQVSDSGYQPRDEQWIVTGEWYVPVPPKTPQDLLDDAVVIYRLTQPPRGTKIEVGDSTIISTHGGTSGNGTGC